MSKKVDGIKKLTKEELEVSRKIVLNSINEEFKKGEEVLNGVPNSLSPSKKVDGIFNSFKFKKKDDFVLSAKKEEKVTEKKKNEYRDKLSGIIDLKKTKEKPELKKDLQIKKTENKKPKIRVSDEDKKALNSLLLDQSAKEEKIRQAELLKQEEIKRERQKQEEKIRQAELLKQEEIKRERQKQEEKLHQMELLKNKKIEEQMLRNAQEKKREEEEKKRKKIEAEERKQQEKELAQKRKEKEEKEKREAFLKKEKEKKIEQERKIKKKEQLKKEKEAFRKMQKEARIKAKEKAKKEREIKIKKYAKKIKSSIKKYKKYFKNFFIYFRFRIFKLTKKVIYFFTVFMVIVLIIYLIFISVVLKFDIDNFFSRFIAKFIPVPAFATNDGIIEYYKYKDLKSNVDPTGEKDVNKRIQALAVQQIAVLKLIEKYGISVSDFENYDEMMGFLKKKAVYDNIINQVAINRIKKIEEMINDDNDFIRIASKFGDKTGKIVVREDSDLPYLNVEHLELKNLKINEVSKIIFSEDGYYIFRCYHKSEEETALNYVFVKGQTLDEYLLEYIKEYKMLSFID